MEAVRSLRSIDVTSGPCTHYSRPKFKTRKQAATRGHPLALSGSMGVSFEDSRFTTLPANPQSCPAGES